ncbi:N-acetyl sugar amidotransferase [Pigmentiphaga sp. CHJ604]|uniref:N-acetyl sugar amidotransferase n=1 Tax=Pigmentiphaga sp. CHJ604 TaxID=3081984 RepID=UPI0030D12310
MQEPNVTCRRCVMDTSASNITFDKEGYCNFCSEFLNRSRHILNCSSQEREVLRNKFIQKVKTEGRGQSYDCIIGVSGGVDSSWALVKAIDLGLRPLAVHMDNGWNSELAQNNISNIVTKLGVDLYTHVIDWDEYRDLMNAFFDADVIDVELLYDNAMLAVNYKLAAEHKTKYILSGSNQSTEGIRMPAGWNWFKRDKRNIRSIAHRHGVRSMRTFPAMGVLDHIKYEVIKKIQWISFLDYFEYEKELAVKELVEHYSYKPYPYKHYESVFTRFYQGYILPKKFAVDKRRLHLSTLVSTGQLSRDEAVASLGTSPYPSPQALEQDIRYFLKKMRWSQQQLDKYLARPEKPHSDYATEKPAWEFLKKAYNILNR